MSEYIFTGVAVLAIIILFFCLLGWIDDKLNGTGIYGAILISGIILVVGAVLYTIGWLTINIFEYIEGVV